MEGEAPLLCLRTCDMSHRNHPLLGVSAMPFIWDPAISSRRSRFLESMQLSGGHKELIERMQKGLTMSLLHPRMNRMTTLMLT